MAAMSDRTSHIHELSAAIQAYVAKEGHFPRGTVPRTPDSSRVLEWRPDQRLSWLTLLLPYLANGEFSNLPLDLDKSWNEDVNQKTGATVIPQFLTPVSGNNAVPYYVNYRVNEPFVQYSMTNYVGIAGVGYDAAEYKANDPATAKKRGIFGYNRETKKDEIKDGLEQTIAAIQVPVLPKSPWIAGGGSTVRGVSEDLDCVKPFVCTRYQGKPGTFAIMADGKVRFIPATIDPKMFQAMCTIAGGERVKNLDDIAPEVPAPEEPAPIQIKAEQPAKRGTVPSPVVQPRTQPNPAAAPQESRNTAARSNDLKRIGLAYHTFVDTNGKPPTRIEDLAPFYENDAAITKAVKDGSYVVLWNGDFRKMTQGTSNTILGYEKEAKDKEGLVLMADGSTKTMSAKDLNAAPKADGK
jgi:hypothetical protein